MATNADSSTGANSGAKWLTAPGSSGPAAEGAPFGIAFGDWLPVDAALQTPALVAALAVLAGGLVLVAFRARKRRGEPPATRGGGSPSTEFTIRLPPAATRAKPTACRWAKDHFRNDAKMTRWVCLECDADAFTLAGQPTTCHRADRKLAGSRL